MKIYRTSNQGVCALLRYIFGPGVHVATILEQPKGATFLIEDAEQRCAEIASTYHRDDGGTGFPVEDPKVFLEEFINTRQTFSAAIEDGKQWRNSQCPQNEK